MRPILKYLAGLLILIPFYINAQVVINLPATIEIYIDKQIMPLSDNWLDSLRTESRSGNVHYKIVTIEASEQQAQVRLYVPQVFSLQRIFYQIIFYYSLLSSETDRLRDHVYLYPYFSDTTRQPYITCTYHPGGKFYFTVNQWSVVPVPPAPDPQQKIIFNQIIDEMLENYQIMESESKEIFQKIAEKNKMPVIEVQSIYENVILWQEAQ